MKVLAFDPGYERLGVAVIEQSNSKENLLYSDCFKTPSDNEYPDRLSQIGDEVCDLISQHDPDRIATETLFLSNNQKTAMRVAGVRGVILYLAAHHGITALEYSPLEIKMAITGYGKSDKKQVTAMVKHLVSIDKKISHDDEYDAIAVGLTALAMAHTPNHQKYS